VAAKVRAFTAAGCTHVVVFPTLHMLAATCPARVAAAGRSAHARRGGGNGGERGERGERGGGGGSDGDDHDGAAAAAAAAPPAADAIAAIPGVEGWAPGGTVHGSAAGGPRRAAAPLWGLDRVNQAALPLDGDASTRGCYPAAGAGVHVFVLDTGVVATHAQLAHLGDRLTAVAAAGSAFPNGTDEDGHGTHVIGTIAGWGTGVARGVNVTSVKVLDGTAAGVPADVVAGVEAAAAYAVAHPTVPVLLSASLGGPRAAGAPDLLATAVERAAVAGVVTITAAGNDGGDACGTTPGAARRVINVANGDRHDALAPTSNAGVCVDVIAPGTHIVSADAAHPTGLTAKTGTSMAAPHVTGVAALVLGEVGRRLSREAVLRAVTWGGVTVAGYPLAYASPHLPGLCPPAAVPATGGA